MGNAENSKVENGSPFARTTGCVDRESLRALDAAQNPRLTAKEMTATQKCDPKQTHASEGTMEFCAKRDNLKFQAQASAVFSLQSRTNHYVNADCQNTPGTTANDQCSNNRSGAQFYGIE